MKLPFFRIAKAATAASPARGSLVSAAVQPSLRQAVASRPEKERTQPIPDAPAPSHSSVATPTQETVPISLQSIASQLPARLFAPGVDLHATTVRLAVPTAWILPQLQSGRVNVKLGDLLRLLPPSLLRNPPPLVPEQQLVALPLSEIVTALPPTAFQTQHEAAVELTTNDLPDLPALFDDEPVQRTAVAETQPTEPSASEASRAFPVSPVPTAATGGEQVLVSLRSLIAALPETVFCFPRAEVEQRIHPQTRVALPAAPLIPQLRTGRLRLPLQTVLPALPAEILAPDAADQETDVALPLAEIVPQLPVDLFRSADTEQAAVDFEWDEEEIPVPFVEKTPTAPPAVPHEPPQQAQTTAVEQFQSEPIEQPCPAEATLPTPAAQEEIRPSSAAASEEVPEVVFAELAPEALPQEPPAAMATAAEARTEPVAPAVTPTVQPAKLQPPPTAAAPESTAGLPIDEKQFLININRCTIEDLLAVEGIGHALARRIIEFRDSRGGLRSLDELRQIPGIGRKTFRALAGSTPRTLNQLLGAPLDHELTLQEVVQYAARLPGVDGVVLAMANGLFVTGQVPDSYDQNAISVFAPQLFKKIARYTRELQVGQVQRMTIFTDRRPISIFHAGEVYLVIIHDTRRFSKALLRRCERISRGIAALCRQRVVI